MHLLLCLALIGLSLASNATPTFTYNLSYSAAELDPCWQWSNQQLSTTEENCRICVEAMSASGDRLNCSFCPLQNLCLSTSVAVDYNGGGCWSIPISFDYDSESSGEDGAAVCAPPGSVGGIRAVSIYSAVIFIGLVAMGAKFWKTSADFKKKVAEAEREDEEPQAPAPQEEKPKKKANGKATQRKTPKKEETPSSSPSSSSSAGSPSRESSGKETTTSSASSPKSSSVTSSDSS